MKLARSFVAIMAVAALAACDDDPTDEDESLAGAYTVSSFEYTPDAGGAGVDLASQTAFGCPCGIVSMNVAADNSFSGQLKFPCQPTATITGDLILSGSNNITIDFSQAVHDATDLEDESGTYDMDGNTLTITLPEVTFDYGALSGNPGTQTPSVLVIVGTRS